MERFEIGTVEVHGGIAFDLAAVRFNTRPHAVEVYYHVGEGSEVIGLDLDEARGLRDLLIRAVDVAAGMDPTPPPTVAAETTAAATTSAVAGHDGGGQVAGPATAPKDGHVYAC